MHRLRSAPSFVPELDYIAELDGKLAGHIIYSKSGVKDDAGNIHETLTFGPLTVLPEFQRKEPYKPTSIDVLLSRLEPCARKAIEGLACHSLEYMGTKSQQEISALAGIDDGAIETIRVVMRELGRGWGESLGYEH